MENMDHKVITGLDKLDYLKRKRYRKTLDFLFKHITKEDRIIDLGTPNPLSGILIANGFNVINTRGEDFDTDYRKICEYEGDVTTSFEVFEHLLAPFNILREIKTDRLIASVPLRLWFAKAYWNKDSEWDRHYHEFEIRQFNWLLEKSGWKIIDSATWAAPLRAIGIKPFLRLFTKRFYIVCCERIRQ